MDDQGYPLRRTLYRYQVDSINSIGRDKYIYTAMNRNVTCLVAVGTEKTSLAYSVYRIPQVIRHEFAIDCNLVMTW